VLALGKTLESATTIVLARRTRLLARVGVRHRVMVLTDVLL
jgi:hypothetical protein